MKRLVGIFLFLVLFITLNATDVSGNQSGIWTLVNSPYNVTGDITVPSGGELEIEAGVEVIFLGDYQITAEGRIYAVGTSDNLIFFKSAMDNDEVSHQGIRLENEALPASIFTYCSFKNAENAINSINSPVSITHSTFEYNDEAIHVFAIGNTNPPSILIEENYIANSVKSGIMIYESSNVNVFNNEITGNGTGSQFRGAIQISIQTTGAPVTPYITENNIHDNHYQGITCVDMFACEGIDAQIFNNTITNNYTGVYFYGCSGTLVGNQITNNFIEGNMNSGAGIMCYGAGATPYIAENTISGNYGGIFITVGAQPIIGAPEMNNPYAVGLNHIENNIDANGNNNSVILNNLSSDITILAKNNFWGTTDTTEIDASITDSNDSASLGTVEYLPLPINSDVSGEQSGVWALANSPYNVIGDITVPANSVLTIEAGVEVLFTGDFLITALGRIIADGTEDNMIAFKASTDSDEITHQGIRLEDEGTEASIFNYCFIKNAENGINSINAAANITNSHFEYNEEAIHIFAIGNTNPPQIQIEDNYIAYSVMSGIMIYESSTTSVINNEITQNGTGPQFRGAIQIGIQTTGAPVTPLISGNNIHHNNYQGITSVDMFGCDGIDAQIFNNTISNNYTGVYFYGCAGTLVGNQITNNFIEGNMNSGAGIMCYGVGATPYIAENTISGNYGGIFITVAAQPIIGAPEMESPYAIGHNHIENNIDANGNNNSVILNNLSSDITILAKNNFWGTTDTTEIDASITDSNDSASLGTVEYLPLASEGDEFTLTLNITSEFSELAEYIVHVRNLATLEVTHHTFTSLEESAVLMFTEPVDLTITGSIDQGMYWQSGYCYYGPFDELNIVSLNDDNVNESIDLTFTAEPRPNTFRTYDYINVNGNDVLPLLKDEFYTDQVKQLVYENDNNDIMLVGYQKYGVNGWENVIFDEELLYLDNDAQTGESFVNNQVSLIGSEYTLYSNSVEVMGVHEQDLDGNTITSKAVNKILDSPWDMETSTWVEYTGNSAPLSVNTRSAGSSDFLATDINYNGDFNQNKLLDLLPNTEINYYTEKVLLGPTNLIQLDETIYWNPCSDDVLYNTTSMFMGYKLFVDSDEMIEIIDLEISASSYDISNYTSSISQTTMYICGYYEDGEETPNSNSIAIIPVSNENSDTIAITSLSGNYPNPFNPETTISFNIPTSGNVSLDIYNVRGQKVKTLVNGHQDAGQHNVVWNGRDDNNNNVSSGVYFYKMKSGRYTSTKKMILMK